MLKRRLIILSIFTIVCVFLAFFQNNNNILPERYLTSLYLERYAPSDAHVVIPVYLLSNDYNFPDLHDAVQTQLNYHLNDTLNPSKINWSIQVLPYPKDVKIDSTKNYVVRVVIDTETAVVLSEGSLDTIIFFNNDVVVSNDLPYFIAQSIVEFTFELEYSRLCSTRLPPVYLPQFNYRNVSNILIELHKGDGLPIDWDIEKALQSWFTPLRYFLAPLVNFTIETSINYYTKEDELKELILSAKDSNKELCLSPNRVGSLVNFDEFNRPALLDNQSFKLALIFPNSTPATINSSLVTQIPRKTIEFFDTSIVPASQEIIKIPDRGLFVLDNMKLPANALLTEMYLLPIMKNFTDELISSLDFKYFITQLLDNPDSVDVSMLNSEYMENFFVVSALVRIITLYHLQTSIQNIYQDTDSLALLSANKNPEIVGKITYYISTRFEVLNILNDPSLGSLDDWSTALTLSNKLLIVSREITDLALLPDQTYSLHHYYYAMISITLAIALTYFMQDSTENTNNLNDSSDTKDSQIKGK